MMQRMQVYIPEKLYLGLKTRAAIEDVSMSRLIRKGLRAVLNLDREKRADPMKIFVGKGRAKEKTDAVKEVRRYYQKLP